MMSSMMMSNFSLILAYVTEIFLRYFLFINWDLPNFTFFIKEKKTTDKLSQKSLKYIPLSYTLVN